MNEVLELLKTITENKKIDHSDPESTLNMKINAIVASNAEHYYHTMVTNDTESWNIRDRHMVEALHHIGDYYGSTAKGIVWEHNTHIGDARATDMASEGMVNVGQLTREKYGHNMSMPLVWERIMEPLSLLKNGGFHLKSCLSQKLPKEVGKRLFTTQTLVISILCLQKRTKSYSVV